MSILVPTYKIMWKKIFPFTFAGFGISQFVSDCPIEIFLIYALDI